MKKILLITGVLLALTATVASAAGINLYWNDCSLGAATTNRNFACTSNTGSNIMTASYDPPAGLTFVNGTTRSSICSRRPTRSRSGGSSRTPAPAV